MQHQDSTGKPISVGDRVRWRGQEYTIKAFKEERDPHFKTPLIEFEEPLHLAGEDPCEVSVDIVAKAPYSVRELSLQENVSTIKLDGIFKSWREEFTSEDVEQHLKDSGVDELVFNGICGDGDILLKTHKGPLTCLSMEELDKVMKAFNSRRVTIEPYDGELLLTLTWNVDARDDHSKHGRGTPEDGPEEPDCACRTTDQREACALAGCGFCLAAGDKPV